MALYFRSKKLAREVIQRLYRELILDNGKEHLKFYKVIEKEIQGIKVKEVALPFYYGRMVNSHPKLSFSRALKLPPARGLMNVRPCHQQTVFTSRVQLWPKQVPILAEAENELRQNGTIFLQVCTGFGKSIAIVELVHRLGYVALIMATRVLFIGQLAEAFKANTDAVLWLPSHKHPVPPPNVQVIITTPDCFKRIDASLIDRIGLLAIDEAPLICTEKCISPLLSLRPRYIISCSATIKRRDGMEIMLDMLYGPAKVLKKLDVPVRVIRWFTGIKVPYYRGKGDRADWGEHSSFICAHPERNAMIVEFISQIVRVPEGNGKLKTLLRKISSREVHKVVVVTNRVDEHVELLKPMIIRAGLTCDSLSAKKKTYKDSQVVIGTSGKVGIGFDPKLASKNYDGHPIDVVFQAVSCATAELAIQELGRACRVPEPHPAIFVMMIDNNSISRKHARTAEIAFRELDDVKFFNWRGAVEEKPEDREMGESSSSEEEPEDND